MLVRKQKDPCFARVLNRMGVSLRRLVGQPFPSQTILDSLLPGQGWQIVEDVGQRIAAGDVLKQILFIKDGENQSLGIDGHELRHRARLLRADFGLLDAKHLLDHPEEVIKLEANIIFFPGTLLSRQRWHGDAEIFGIPCLHLWREEEGVVGEIEICHLVNSTWADHVKRMDLSPRP